MSLKRYLGLSTTNHYKLLEIQYDFAYYGIDVIQLKSPFTQQVIDDFYELEKTNNSKDEKGGKNRIKIMGIIREQTTLHGDSTKQLEKVVHESKVTLYTNNSPPKTYINKTSGYIDLTKRTYNKCFNWDDIFVVDNIYKTYYELSNLNHKFSARNKCISEVIRDIVHYDKHVDLYHIPQKYTRCVDFTKDPYNIVKNTKEFNNQLAINMQLANIPIQALNNGMFFRSAKNRRQKLYWCPGLNAGIPFVPKPKDIGQEITYMFHDFSHFNIPDLVFTGNHSPLVQKTYIAYRLMSEVFTLGLGDMMFVHTMIGTGIEYKTVNQRKLYPLFKLMEQKLFSENKDVKSILKVLMFASYHYCFYGDTSGFRALMPDTQESIDCVNEFTSKYDAYFLEDFRWTHTNYKYMISNTSQYADWWQQILPIIRVHKIDLRSVEEWINEFGLHNQMTNREITDCIFESVFNTYIAPLFNEPGLIQLLPQETRIKNGFIRYMLGQSLIFSRFKDIYSNASQQWRILKYSLINLNTKDLDKTIQNIRSYYEDCLLKMEESSLISNDDRETFKEVYPIFNPYIVDYDHSDLSLTLGEFTNMMLDT